MFKRNHNVGNAIYTVGLVCSLLVAVGPKTQALDGPLTVGATYYGGEYDETKQSWVVDNTDQCNRIAAGEFTAESLAAVVADVCDDDSGLGYLNDTQLHNRVGYAELSNPPSYGDFSALGNLPAGTKLEINYQGRCVVAEKLDVGTGGYGVGAFPRAIDFWWQTARSLGFKNGFDTVIISPVTSTTPLSPIGQTSPCGAIDAAAGSAVPPKKRATGSVKNTPNQVPENSSPAPIESPKDTSSRAFVRLPKTEARSHGPLSASPRDWYRVASYAIIAIFIAVELLLYAIILRRRNHKHSKRKFGHFKKTK